MFLSHARSQSSEILILSVKVKGGKRRRRDQGSGFSSPKRAKSSVRVFSGKHDVRSIFAKSWARSGWKTQSVKSHEQVEEFRVPLRRRAASLCAKDGDRREIPRTLFAQRKAKPQHFFGGTTVIRHRGDACFRYAGRDQKCFYRLFIGQCWK